MKRNSFIKFCLATASLAATPFAGIANRKNKDRPGKGFKIPAGEGRIHGHIRLKGVNSNILDVKISGTDTEGELAIFEQTSLSRGVEHHYIYTRCRMKYFLYRKENIISRWAKKNTAFIKATVFFYHAKLHMPGHR